MTLKKDKAPSGCSHCEASGLISTPQVGGEDAVHHRP